MSLTRRKFVAAALGVLATPALGTPTLAGGRMHEVKIRKFTFTPDRLELRPGDRICFTNHDLAPHTATALDGSWDSDTLEQGQSIILTVTDDWSGDYFCAYHPQMKATLVISAQ